MINPIINSFIEKLHLAKTKMEVLLASTSPLKKTAVENSLAIFFGEKKITVTCCDCDYLKLPPQPINSSTLYCAYERLKYAKNKIEKKFDMCIAVENGIQCEKTGGGVDVCHIIVEYDGMTFTANSLKGRFNQPMHVDEKYVDKMRKSVAIWREGIEGYSKTVGEIINEEDWTIDPKNWTKVLCGADRKSQIDWAIRNLYHKYREMTELREKIKASYVEYKDYPNVGVDFKDLFSVLRHGWAVSRIGAFMAERFLGERIDYVIGLESRGFILGIMVAKELSDAQGCKVGFLPARKPGKLPGKSIGVEYTKEYGTDKLEMQTDVKEGSKVLIVDDLIATGGSIAAGVKLAMQLKCNVVACCVLVKVDALWELAKKVVKSEIVVLIE